MKATVVEARESIHSRRLQRLKAGETVLEIAQSEGVSPSTVFSSIHQASLREQMLFAHELWHLRLEGAIENEKCRQQLRDLFPKLRDAILSLLSGRRTITHTDPVTGQITLHEIIDPDVIAMGVDQLAQIVGLYQKPEPNQITVSIYEDTKDPVPSTTIDDQAIVDRLRRAQLNRAQTT